MRTDYEYVDQATAMCICTTRLGDERLEPLMRPDVEVPKSIAVEILLTIQDEYIVVEDGGITSWVTAIQKHRKKEHLEEIPAEDLHATLAMMFAEDVIGVHKVVWDEGDRS